MTQLDQQLLTTLFLSEGPQIRENAALKAITRIATLFVLVVGTGLLAVAAADRLEADDVTARVLAPSPEYLHAVAASEAWDREEAVQSFTGQSTEASAR